jgi:hypothetical protein
MRNSISRAMKKGKQDYDKGEKEREQWVLDHPA